MKRLVVVFLIAVMAVGMFCVANAEDYKMSETNKMIKEYAETMLSYYVTIYDTIPSIFSDAMIIKVGWYMKLYNIASSLYLIESVDETFGDVATIFKDYGKIEDEVSEVYVDHYAEWVSGEMNREEYLNFIINGAKAIVNGKED